MSQTTYIDAASERVEAERAAAEAKRAEMGSFLDRVADLPVASSPAGASGVAGTGGLAHRTDTSGTGGCEAVRTAFAETVSPHAVAGGNTGASTAVESESLTATIRAELTD